MKVGFKIIMIVLLGLFGALSAFIILEECRRAWPSLIDMFVKDVTLLYPFFMALLCASSVYFNISTLSLESKNFESLRSFVYKRDSVIDFSGINRFFWVVNILLGLYLIGIGIFLSVLVYNSPSSSDPKNFLRYLICMIFYLLGAWVIGDELLVYLRLKKRKAEFISTELSEFGILQQVPTVF